MDLSGVAIAYVLKRRLQAAFLAPKSQHCIAIHHEVPRITACNDAQLKSNCLSISLHMKLFPSTVVTHPTLTSYARS